MLSSENYSNESIDMELMFESDFLHDIKTELNENAGLSTVSKKDLFFSQ